MTTERTVVPLPNTPSELCDYAVSLGAVKEDIHFAEVFSLDEEWAEFVPRPAYAVLFIFPIGPADGVLEQRGKDPVELPNPQPWFTKQLMSNQCGTIAILHSIVNLVLQGVIHVRPDSWFAKFIEQTRDKTPDERGKAIYDDDALYETHQKSAQESDVPIPEDCDTHFAAFVKIGENLWELDGRKPQPIFHGKVDDVVLATLNVIKKDYMPHITDPLRISLCAITAVPKE